MNIQNKRKKAWKLMPVDWLLAGEPFIKYNVLMDLLDRDKNNKEVIKAKNSIVKHALIKRIFEKRNNQGYWGSALDIYKWWPKKDTTFWLLGILADFGLDKGTRRIARACEYVFSTQLPGGGFGWSPPPTPGDCFTGILTESLAKLGYTADPRLRQAYDWLLNRQRHDGGFWCKNTGLPGRPRQHEPSCAFGTLCVLGALSCDPKLKNRPVAARSIEFLLGCWDNRGKICYAGHDSQVGKGWDKLKYPFTDYRILKYLDILTRYDSAVKDRRMREMAAVLISKRDKDGRFSADSIHKVWSDFDFGQKKQPSRWITFLAYRILKRIGG